MSADGDSTSLGPRLAQVSGEIVESVYQHRLLSTNQIHALHTPGSSKRWTQLVLAELRRTGLLACSTRPGGLRLWYATELGAETVEAATANRAETRRRLLSPEQAAGALQAHTLAVNDVGIAFVKAARERGDECGWFAWRHEIAHPLGRVPGRGFEWLIADALLSYQQHHPDGTTSFHYRFVELDRATMQTELLAAKLARYARLHRNAPPRARGGSEVLPYWTADYPVFPSVLLVLAGKPRPVLERRRRTVLALAARHRELSATPEVHIACCLLQDLTAHGPFAAVFRSLADLRAPADWLGDSGDPPPA
jgi:hypothetical protein